MWDEKGILDYAVITLLSLPLIAGVTTHGLSFRKQSRIYYRGWTRNWAGYRAQDGDEGAMVALAEIDFESAQSAAEELLKQDCQAFAIQADITRETEVQAAVSQVRERFGRIDILVNNAGKTFNYDATTMSEADWDNAMNVDVKGAWLCCKHSPSFDDHFKAGSIVNIASVPCADHCPKTFPVCCCKICSCRSNTKPGARLRPLQYSRQRNLPRVGENGTGSGLV
jgi:hypothetical protein